MDLTSEFASEISPRLFHSFTEFKRALDKFCDSYGVGFKIKRSSAYKRADEARKKLVYEMLHYTCDCKCKLDCLSFFRVGVRNGCLYVRKMDMRHNHEHREPNLFPWKADPSDVQVPGAPHNDSTRLFEDTISSCDYSSYKEFDLRLQCFQKLTGAKFTKAHTVRWPESSPESIEFIYRHIVFTCKHGGTAVSKASKGTRTRTNKMGCPSTFRVSCKKGRLMVLRYNMQHNHELTQEPNHTGKKFSWNSFSEEEMDVFKADDAGSIFYGDY